MCLRLMIWLKESQHTKCEGNSIGIGIHTKKRYPIDLLEQEQWRQPYLFVFQSHLLPLILTLQTPLETRQSSSYHSHHCIVAT